VPALPTSPRLRLFLTGDELWSEGIQPWIERGRGKLERSYIVVATRGQALGLKQRCVEMGLPLLGVEVVTPGLARRRWMSAQRESARPAMGRELLNFGLRSLIEQRWQASREGGGDRGFWLSLRSDPEGVLQDWDDLLRAGHPTDRWPSPLLRQLMTDLEAWVESQGFTLSARQDRQLALRLTDECVLADRVLVAGLGAEMAAEFWGVVGLLARSRAAEIWLPEPDFALGATAAQEAWVERWQAASGTEAEPSTVVDTPEGCAAAGDVWSSVSAASELRTDQVALIVGEDRGDEMAAVAVQVAQWLDEGATRVGVVVPRGGPGHLALRQELAARGIEFNDLVGVTGPAALDEQLQRAVLHYHRDGATLEGLIALWPRLLAAGKTTLRQDQLRRRLERDFERSPQHEVAVFEDRWKDREPELGRVVAGLGKAWPEALSLADALGRWRAIGEWLEWEEFEGIEALNTLATRDDSPHPRRVVTDGIAEVIPTQWAAQDGIPPPGFARVHLGSWRQLVGLSWSHLAWTEANAGVWPHRERESPWWPEADRVALADNAGTDGGWLTAAERREVDRAGWRRLVRDTRVKVAFSAARFEAESPETELAPNTWLERIIARTEGLNAEAGVSRVLAMLARRRTTEGPGTDDRLAAWQRRDETRRDPTVPFGPDFHGSGSVILRPEHLSPRLIEQALADPAALWYEGVLGLSRLERGTLLRSVRRAIGARVHHLLAGALRPEQEVRAGFGPMPMREEAQARLARAVTSWQQAQPRGLFERAMVAEIEGLGRALLHQVYAMAAGDFIAVERNLDAEALLPLGAHAIPLRGRMDLVRSDRPGWRGASIDVVDFKTGGDSSLSARRMGTKGESVQLGVYLQAVMRAGARDARVWMIKPDEVSVLHHDELDTALRSLDWLAAAVDRGVYGALTPDRSPYGFDGYEGPRAVRPVPAAVLQKKFAQTFAAAREGSA